jgi:hypothetical protein
MNDFSNLLIIFFVAVVTGLIAPRFARIAHETDSIILTLFSVIFGMVSIVAQFIFFIKIGDLL